VPALGAVESLDVGEDSEPGFMSGLERLALHEFRLDAGHEALGGGVIKGVSSGPHRSQDPGVTECAPEGQRAVLADQDQIAA
jgi:hypothetical protein